MGYYWEYNNTEFLMAEELSKHFSTVFTRQDISPLPTPVEKFNGPKTQMLGQLIITTEVVAIIISIMKENKYPGVDGIPPKILYKTVEQIIMPHVFNMSLQEGYVPSECLSRPYCLHVTARGRSSFRALVQALLLAYHCKREKLL